jgi:hypothetical protein
MFHWNFPLYSLGADPTENAVFYCPVLLPSNRRPIVARVGFLRRNVLTESLPSNGSVRHKTDID